MRTKPSMETITEEEKKISTVTEISREIKAEKDYLIVLAIEEDPSPDQDMKIKPLKETKEEVSTEKKVAKTATAQRISMIETIEMILETAIDTHMTETKATEMREDPQVTEMVADLPGVLQNPIEELQTQLMR